MKAPLRRHAISCISVIFLCVANLEGLASQEKTVPTKWIAKLTQKVDRYHKALLEEGSSVRFLQGNSTVDIDLKGVCEEYLAFESSYEGVECTCSRLENGNFMLNCRDLSCTVCDEDFEECGIFSYSWEFGPKGNPPDFVVGGTVTIEYTTGETATLEQSACQLSNDFEFSCSECGAFVNGDLCSSCTVCEDGISISVDCENLSANSSFSECFSGPTGYGIFEGLTFFTCLYDAPENDACANSTMLQMQEVVYARTNGATFDEISSNCNVSDGNDVWFSVMGTGGTIVATTCSSQTFVDTDIDVFTGLASCESLECVTAMSSSCVGFFSGRSVSWFSEEDVLYYLRISTDDFDDQFELFTFGVPAAENMFCNTSIVSSSIDSVGSTLELSEQREQDICGEDGTSGLWYQVIAMEDSIMRASTCSNSTSVYTAITVMTGSDCESLSCVDSSNGFQATAGCTEGGTSVEWNATSDQTYFVYVRGTDSNGVFGITVASLQTPDNDSCGAASVLSSNDGVVTGNTLNATEDIIVGSTCSDETFVTPRGIWYRVIGNGIFFKATVCSGSFDEGPFAEFMEELPVSVYSGDCLNLTCFAESASTGNCGPVGGRTVSWEAADGIEYFLFVHSPFTPGPFEILVEEFEPESNTRCSNATGPIFPANQTIVASTINAVSDDIPGCLSGETSPGLWYWVLGQEGKSYRVDTCSNETNFDTEISVFSGVCGVELECLGGNDDSCGGFSSSAQWRTEEGQIYYIKIHGHFQDVGNFGMTLSSFDSPVNDDCSGSIVLTPSDNATIAVSTAGATTDIVGVCSFDLLDAPGLWFQISGEGKAITVSTCFSFTKIATSISVFSGSCGDLSCVSEGITDFSCQELGAGTATFLAEEGVEYYLLVQSADGLGGDVGLKVSEFESMDNNFCQGATKLTVDGGDVVGSTVGASGGTPLNDCVFDSSFPDVWYFFEGTGDVLRATACSSEFDFSFSVLGGNCTDSQCIGTVSFEPCATIRFQSILGEEYHMLVQAIGDFGTGEFSVSVNTSSAQTEGNDLCSNAEFIDPNSNSTVTGSTLEAIQDLSVEDTCFSISTGGDRWYQVLGKGNDTVILASLCSPETDFDTQLSVYTSFDENGSCSNLECVTTNDDACGGSASQVSWRAEEGRVYHIRVYGFGTNAGNFALTVEEQKGSGEACEGADVIELSGFSPFVIVEGSTAAGELSGFPEVSPCGIEPNGPSAWFQIPGVTGQMTASTCFELTDFDTIVEVYDGNCEMLSCVDVNDDSTNVGGTQVSGCSLVSWTASEGIDYFVRVSGFLGAQGNFELITSLQESELVVLGGN